MNDIIYTSYTSNIDKLFSEVPMKKITLLFPDFKTKALTFSFDDGIDSDIETVELIKKYEMKATFNICSGHFNYTKDGDVRKEGQLCMPLSRNQAKALFSDPHTEVASHGQYHPALGHIAGSEAMWDIINDRRDLEELFGCLVRGHAYPFASFDQNVMDMMRLSGFAYARSVDSHNSFRLPSENEWLCWAPSCHWRDASCEKLVKEFTEQENLYYNGWLFYIWGHSYEFRETPDGFDRFEGILKKLAFRDDTWYATNIEICEYVKAFRSLIYYADGKTAYNPTQIDVYMRADHECGTNLVCIPAGETVRLAD